LVIYGVSFLAGCLLAGLFAGDLLGQLIGVEANVGGVGIAMLLMILLSDKLRKLGKLNNLTEQGVLFWSSIYIPVVVAMAAKQNVLAALKGGPAAILAGAGAVLVSFALVPLLSRLVVQPEDGTLTDAATDAILPPGSGKDEGAP
jgi:malonate transporter MadL subunit